MDTPLEIYEALEFLRGVEPGGMLHARASHFLATSGSTTLILADIARIEAQIPTMTATVQPKITGACTRIRGYLADREATDLLLRDRLMAIDPLWAEQNQNVLMLQPDENFPVKGVIYNGDDLARIDVTVEPFATGYTNLVTKHKPSIIAGVRETVKFYGALDYVWWNPGPVVNSTEFTQVRDDGTAIAVHALLAVVGPELNRAAHRAKAMEGLAIWGAITGYDQNTGNGKLEASWFGHNAIIAVDLLEEYTHPIVGVLQNVIWPMMYHPNSENWGFGMSEVQLGIALITDDDSRWDIGKDQFYKWTRCHCFDPSRDLDNKVNPVYRYGLTGTADVNNTITTWRNLIDNTYTILDPALRVLGMQPEDDRDPGHINMSMATAWNSVRMIANVEGWAAIPDDILDRLEACTNRHATRFKPWLVNGTMPTNPTWKSGNGGNANLAGWLQQRRGMQLAGRTVTADLDYCCNDTRVKDFGPSYLNMTLGCLVDL